VAEATGPGGQAARQLGYRRCPAGPRKSSSAVVVVVVVVVVEAASSSGNSGRRAGQWQQQ
jgi:hypothetical protein